MGLKSKIETQTGTKNKNKNKNKKQKNTDMGGQRLFTLTGIASHTKPGHLIELKYVLILKIYRALDKNDSFLTV